MNTVIDQRRQMIVDHSSCAEIRGAESVDLDANTVVVCEKTYDGEAQRIVSVPAGVTIVRRR